MTRTISLLMTALVLATVAAPHVAALAQDTAWPTRPVRIIVPSGPGSVTDAQARWLSARLAPLLGQSVIVDNHPGAGGNIGTTLGSHSAPDGYTLTIVHQGTMAFNPHLYSKLAFDPLTDFAPITYLGVNPLLLAVSPNVPATSVAELVKLAKAKPSELNFGSPGIGTPPHMASELFKRAAGIDVVHVPYSGGGRGARAPLPRAVPISIQSTATPRPPAGG